LSRAWATDKVAGPSARAISGPLIVRADPHTPHSIRTLAPKRHRSVVVRTCLVDMVRRYAHENDS
jgi:hypothetical protein